MPRTKQTARPATTPANPRPQVASLASRLLRDEALPAAVVDDDEDKPCPPAKRLCNKPPISAISSASYSSDDSSSDESSSSDDDSSYEREERERFDRRSSRPLDSPSSLAGLDLEDPGVCDTWVQSRKQQQHALFKIVQERYDRAMLAFSREMTVLKQLIDDEAPLSVSEISQTRLGVDVTDREFIPAIYKQLDPALKVGAALAMDDDHIEDHLRAKYRVSILNIPQLGDFPAMPAYYRPTSYFTIPKRLR